MTTAGLLVEALGRIPEHVHGVVEGLTPEQLTRRLDAGSNTIAWLVWHLTRIEDDHVSHLAGSPQVWTAGGWARRWALDLDDRDTGWGHSEDQVAAVTGRPDMLLGYFDATHAMATKFAVSLTDGDLDRIVDRRWNPPVTLGVRLISVVGHNYEQAGQAAFIRGFIERTPGKDGED